jgi:hypothetical protein
MEQCRLQSLESRMVSRRGYHPITSRVYRIQGPLAQPGGGMSGHLPQMFNVTWAFMPDIHHDACCSLLTNVQRDLGFCKNG